MSAIAYRVIFDEVNRYIERPNFTTVSRLAKEKYDEVFGELLTKFKYEIWDGTTRLDSRSIEDFKKEVPVLPDSELYYITREGNTLGLWTQSIFDGSKLTKDTVNDVAEKHLDDVIQQFTTRELASRIIDELIEKELGDGK
jgi:hypothetical protein